MYGFRLSDLKHNYLQSPLLYGPLPVQHREITMHKLYHRSLINITKECHVLENILKT